MRAMAWLILGALLGCAHGETRTQTPKVEQAMVITEAAQIADAVGKRVTLRGLVQNSKVAALLGVDVESESPDLRGREATATGTLHRQVVTQEQLDRQIAEMGMFAHRGPGTYYSLVDETGRLAQVRPPQ